MFNDAEYSNKMLEAFIGKPDKTLWYQNAFKKYDINGIDVMKWHWSWWAFGAGSAFLLYRKQYLAALGLFILSMSIGMIPFVTLILMILSGGYSTYFVYKGYKKKLAEVEANVEDLDKRIETMQALGGYHSWVIWIYVIFSALFFFYVFAMTMSLVNM